VSDQSRRQVTATGVATPKYELDSAGKLMFLRVFATLLSCLILWTSSDAGTNFFKTLTVFAISQLLYALSIKCVDVIRRIFSFVSLGAILIILLISLSGLMGIAEITLTDVGYMILFSNKINQIPFMRSEIFVYVIATSMCFLYVIEWATGWYADMNGEIQITNIAEEKKGCD
jgi:hypothetical protein